MGRRLSRGRSASNSTKERQGKERGNGSGEPKGASRQSSPIHRPGLATFFVEVSQVGPANDAVNCRCAEMATRRSPENQRHVGIWHVRSAVDADLQRGEHRIVFRKGSGATVTGD